MYYLMIGSLIGTLPVSIQKQCSLILACILLVTTISRCDGHLEVPYEGASLRASNRIIETEINIASHSLDSGTNQSTDKKTLNEVTTVKTTSIVGSEPTVIETPKNSAGGDSVDEIDTATTTPVPPKESPQCMDNNYCLNGGTCVLTESGQMLCLCPENFYGARCQTRNICKTIIADSLSGDQICAKINRSCFRNDKFFRCQCEDDEYFVFKIIDHKIHQQSKTSMKDANPFNTKESFEGSQIFDGDSKSDEQSSNTISTDLKEDIPHSATYLAECRKIDKCIGVRCKQMSEMCQDGNCVCNQALGYILDPTDGVCKLLNPCTMPQPDGLPICGQAQCYPTYDQDLYGCLCPVGYTKIRTGALKSSTQCVLMSDTVCDVPLLNKCQHLCRVDKYADITNSYVCSCLPGYKSGTNVGVDDHMCFFDESIEQNIGEDYGRSDSHQLKSNTLHVNREYVYKLHLVPRQTTAHEEKTPLESTFIYDPIIQSQEAEEAREQEDHLEADKKPILYETIIKRELRTTSSRDATGSDGENFNGASVSKMSAQDRCNMYCEENKICVLESGSTDSYKCVCDRQGYLSVGDRCLDWCAAAEFIYKFQGVLEMICLSGACKTTGDKPSSLDNPKTVSRLDRESSWRPTFECDCTSSNDGLLTQDPETKRCKINYQAIIEPCKPGNVGYIDCVEHKNAFCAVLHRPIWWFLRDLRKPSGAAGLVKGADDPQSEATTKGKAKSKMVEKSYICVCSPDKKFLVDKPRNKERCVDECDLLNVECGRFNRMCRGATIAPDDLGRFTNLVRIDPDGARLNFKRTGCECLPGFNVGPLETVDFTLDDNKDPTNGHIPGTPETNLIPEKEGLSDSEHFRAKYMNINSRCLLDYDVVEFHASFRAPHDFDPSWVKIRNASPLRSSKAKQQLDANNEKAQKTYKQAKDNLHYTNDPISGSIINDTPTISKTCNNTNGGCVLEPPDFMRYDISELHKSVILVAQCEPLIGSIEAFQECTKYRYWIMLKLRNHFIDWRRVLTAHMKETFDLMEGNIRLRVNKCEATLKTVEKSIGISSSKQQIQTTHFSINEKDSKQQSPVSIIDPIDYNTLIDADIDCELTLHSASDDTSPPYARKVLLEKQLQRFIFIKPIKKSTDYYLMAPNMLIRRESFDQLADHRKLFNPCNSDYEYCDKQTKCEMVDTVNFTCTCEYGYTPIGSRDIYYEDSRKEVCEDINECLFEVCKEISNVSTCINEIGDYRCQCNRHYTGDNKRYCTHVCSTIPCKQGKCRLVDDHHAFCECDEGYKEADCSVQDPNVALRKANMIICGSIFTSVLLLAITFAISLNSQLKKTKKKLKRLEAANDTAHLFEFNHQQPFRPRMSKVSVCS